MKTTCLAFVDAINMCFVCGNFSFRLKAFETEEKSIFYESMSRLVVDKEMRGWNWNFVDVSCLLSLAEKLLSINKSDVNELSL